MSSRERSSLNPRIGPKIGTDFRKARCVDLKCQSVLVRPRGRTPLLKANAAERRSGISAALL
ncbi:hypothetical protein ELH91_25205 (plasmid) [Rhizobium leguminosarum]|nr:hypothetical protein ELH91_25205 [Rhizobium leguminosarum]